MSISSRNYSDSDNKLELPVFVIPTELYFDPQSRRKMFTVYNPFDDDAQFRVMTSSPDIFDVNIAKGTLKPNRRIDITIQLHRHKAEELPHHTDGPQVISSFKIQIQIGHLKGGKQIKVYWSTLADLLYNEESNAPLISEAERDVKAKSRASKLSPSMQSSPSSQSASLNRSSSYSRVPAQRSSRSNSQLELNQNGSNVNLVCTLCAIACVIALFLPISIDSEQCSKMKSIQDQPNSSTGGLLSFLSSLLSLSYEMKLGCSFALGLFTYRLISTLPD